LIIFNFNHFLFKLQAINWMHAWCGEFAGSISIPTICKLEMRAAKLSGRGGRGRGGRAEAAAVQPTLVRYQLVARLLSRNDNSKANGGAGFFARRRRRRATAITQCFLKEMYETIHILFIIC